MTKINIYENRHINLEFTVVVHFLQLISHNSRFFTLFIQTVSIDVNIKVIK